MEGKRCCLRIPLDILKASPEVRACLASIIDLGYDLRYTKFLEHKSLQKEIRISIFFPIFSLFERAELDIMCTKPGYFLNISKKIKENFNCIIVADSFEESAPFFANENICIFNCGNYEDYLLPYAKELMSSNAGSTHS